MNPNKKNSFVEKTLNQKQRSQMLLSARTVTEPPQDTSLLSLGQQQKSEDDGKRHSEAETPKLGRGEGATSFT